ncbi:MAG: transposase, partial [Gammaproteobacteria bacterium]|nr:transposase [Gammaproteobacteria bacterium]
MTLKTIDPQEFHACTSKLRSFFESRGFIEVHTQSRLSILAACEDPRTIATYNYAGQVWPLPQTGQMWLEYELLNNPQLPGVFCVSTSFRNEPNPLPGRHDLIFPMFEFESHGNIDDLQKMEQDLLVHLGFGTRDQYVEMDYLDASERYQTDDISADIEGKIAKEFGPVFFLKNFPQYTSPFWNMKKNGDKANKIDVILHGMETIGSAERSADKEEMRNLFNTISDGMYADILHAQFGRERVQQELDEFLSHDFFPRYGGGIGMTRMIRAMKL